MKTMLKTMLFCTLLAPACAYAVPSTYPTGVTFYNPEKAYNGYTVIAYGTPRIVDMNGNLVKEWKGGYDGFPNKALPGGLMMTTGKVITSLSFVPLFLPNGNMRVLSSASSRPNFASL